MLFLPYGHIEAAQFWLVVLKVSIVCATKGAGYTGRTSDDLVKGHNLLYWCDPCLEVAHETRYFMSQTKGVLKGVISTFAAARDSFRRADGLRGIGLYTT